MTLYAEVILSLPLNQTFSYIIPEYDQENAQIGSRVLVPFRQRLITGFIVKLRKRKFPQDRKLKEVSEILDEKPTFTKSFLSFTQKLSDYYYSSWGELLQASIPPSFILKSKRRIFLTDEGKLALQDRSLPREEKEIMDFLLKRSYSEFFLRRKLKIKNLPVLVSRLEKKDFIRVEKDIKRVKRKTKTSVSMDQTQLEIDFSLDENSRQISDRIFQNIRQKHFSSFFLYGPSEKREAVYFNLIKKILAREGKILYLVPEIILTQTLVEKFERKLGEKAAVLHSRLSERKRELEWRRIKEGKVDVVVGPRSALFSPLEDLELVIVDEEHDESFFQQESPVYDARKGSWLRAKQEKAILVFGSATPSVEGFYRAKKKGHALSFRNGAEQRKIEIIDIRREKGIISTKFKKRIEKQLRKKEPILIFVNRRGYASYLFCSRCQYVPRCLSCDITLTYHRREENLVCHYCSFSVPRVDFCPECGSKVILKRGVGIEAVEEELKNLFPRAKVACFDTDVSHRKGDQEKILHAFKKKRIDILLGTQLLAHQAELPSASLIAILNPEITLSLSDFRASQKAYQSIRHMSEFLSDDDEAAVVIQTAFPEHYSIRTAAFDDYLSFLSQELKYRRLMNYPPYSHMVEILFLGENLRLLAKNSREFSARVKKRARDIEILGPAMASVSMVRGLNRVQLILKAQSKKSLDDILEESLSLIKVRKSVLVYDR